jgi:leader peptidase (prepilin peptidase)/N-methyltransferase
MITLWYLLCVIFITALCWGSFLNVIAYRLACDEHFFTARSYCPQCRTTLAWYDLIPIFSWLLLRGKCRSCRASISFVYPLIELCTALSITLYSYGIFSQCIEEARLCVGEIISIQHPDLIIRWTIMVCFFSALLINAATDLYTLSVLQIFTLWPLPIIWLASWYGAMPLSLLESLTGSIIGYSILWSTARLFRYLKGYDGMGEGDFEILALIGSITGPFGVFKTLFTASLTGALCGIAYLCMTKKESNTAIPFGPFLALGALCYILPAAFLQHAPTILAQPEPYAINRWVATNLYSLK